jgi:hypothetical protein
MGFFRRKRDRANLVEFTANLYTGSGRELNIELFDGEPLWIRTDSGITRTDVWVKACGDAIDLRVSIQRVKHGLQVTVDRGELRGAWWPESGAPRLTVTLDGPSRTAQAVASAGSDGDFQEVLLGESEY